MNNIKGILLDLDNTLYDYERAHAKAIKAALLFFSTHTGINTKEGETLYLKARKQINAQLVNTAASHNRLLYFQRMLEILGTQPLTCALESYHTYWNTFIANIELFDGVPEFFANKNGRKITIVTDLTVEIQHRKLHDLNLFKDIDFLVTSEEAGVDKPNPKMFELALEKMNCAPDQAIMIGDNFEKDIMGANNCGIKAMWLNRNKKSVNHLHENIKEFKQFKDIQRAINHA